VLYEAMQRVARSRPGVGRDVLLVQTTPFANPSPRSFDEVCRTRQDGDVAPIEIDFASAVGPDLLDAGPAGRVPVRYTPWLLSPWQCRVSPASEMGPPGVSFASGMGPSRRQ
jgi:hypothetical protein